jgi:heme/copper-type cytochrome/quinol oxidase subunit 3
MEGSASAPTHPQIELEPPEWQPRAMWVGTRQLAGAAAFFFISFVFAYFYLRSLDVNKDWKIGHVSPPIGLPIIIVLLLVVSAALVQMAASDQARTVSAGSAALVLMFLTVVLQVIEWTLLGFGPASGGYASVYVGWTVFYAFFTLLCMFWVETQVATVWRRKREGVEASPAHTLEGTAVLDANLKACSFFWNFYVFNGIVLFVILYLL